MNISVFGTGYVGLVTGTCFADFGMNVTCVDTDEAKIKMLQDGKIPIYEPGLEFLVQKNVRENRLTFTTDAARGIESALVIIIAVGTPQDESGAADLSAIREVAISIGKKINGYKVVATKSTVPAGTGAWIARIISENMTERFAFDMVSNPEFLREGSAIEDCLRPDRVVIGAESEQAVAIMKDIYSPLYLIETPFVITDVASAEMIKYASNAFLATKISFINEVSILCEKVGADVHHVAKGMGLDKRIGPKFLHPGPGYGGSCFPKDTLAFADLARKNDHELKIVDATIAANKRQRHDPAAMENAKKMFDQVEFVDDVYTLADGADCLVFVTEWNSFRKLDMGQIKSRLKRPLIVDLRNIYEPSRMKELGFEYHAVGRSTRTGGSTGFTLHDPGESSGS
ncbi:MAG: UDP-glucose/GDP-mannose dehydrogenase family protein [Candidatus Riflebacteria bacterium]|nr:UDP-glucose/GDP-mannose dehydrogenase family protein [Candidatus Riflebacteria bacterium]